jgi:hypothetical protein
MGLPTKSTNTQYGTGVYINKATIIGAVDMSEEGLSFLTQPVDVAIVLTLDIGKTFNPEMSFFGNYKRDNRNNLIVDWGGAYSVRNLFTACGIDSEINDDGSIPSELLKALIGKEILRLQYVSGIREKDDKPKYSDWTQTVLAGSEKPEKLAKLFEQSVAKGYPKNYSPEVLSSNGNGTSHTTEDNSDMAIPAAPVAESVEEDEAPF